MPDSTGFHRIDHLISYAKNSIMDKTGGDGMTAIDAGKFLIGSISAKLQCFFNDWGEIFVISDMHSARISNHICGVDTVSIRRFRRHQTVGGK